MFSGKRKKWLALVALILPLLLSHSAVEAAAKNDKEVKLEKVDGTELSKITLTPKAVERLDIKTTKVREEPIEADDLDDVKEDRVKKKKVVVPYSALLYDEKGNTWIYISPEPLTFVRYAIKIDDIEEDNLVVLADGPPIGTEVVTIGVSELYGAEKGIGK